MRGVRASGFPPGQTKNAAGRSPGVSRRETSSVDERATAQTAEQGPKINAECVRMWRR
jgi:hypothetical protein